MAFISPTVNKSNLKARLDPENRSDAIQKGDAESGHCVYHAKKTQKDVLSELEYRYFSCQKVAAVDHCRRNQTTHPYALIGDNSLGNASFLRIALGRRPTERRFLVGIGFQTTILSEDSYEKGCLAVV